MIVPPVQRWEIPEQALSISLDEMKRDGKRGNEGTALWLGRRHNGGIAMVSHVVCLRGAGIYKAPNLLQISSSLLNDVADVASERGVYLIGQIHSHGWDYVDLSPTDHEFGVRAPWFLSVVAPDYGQGQVLELSSCGVHIFEPEAGFVRLTASQIFTALVTTSGLAERLEVGG